MKVRYGLLIIMLLSVFGCNPTTDVLLDDIYSDGSLSEEAKIVCYYTIEGKVCVVEAPAVVMEEVEVIETVDIPFEIIEEVEESGPVEIPVEVIEEIIEASEEDSSEESMEMEAEGEMESPQVEETEPYVSVVVVEEDEFINAMESHGEPPPIHSQPSIKLSESNGEQQPIQHPPITFSSANGDGNNNNSGNTGNTGNTQNTGNTDNCEGTELPIKYFNPFHPMSHLAPDEFLGGAHTFRFTYGRFADLHMSSGGLQPSTSEMRTAIADSLNTYIVPTETGGPTRQPHIVITDGNIWVYGRIGANGTSIVDIQNNYHDNLAFDRVETDDDGFWIITNAYMTIFDETRERLY